MTDLVEGARAGDHFVFHCKFTYDSGTWQNTQTAFRADSGHGSQVENFDQTEDDGMDEGLRQFCLLVIVMGAHGKANYSDLACRC